MAIRQARTLLKSYSFSLILILSMLTGAGLGLVLKDKASVVKPLGDLFLNLLFTTVVPLVFFSISSSVAAMRDMARLRQILFAMLFLFTATGIVSSLIMVVGVKAFPPTMTSAPAAEQAKPSESADHAQANIIRAFTVPDFADLLSKKNMLALIVFAFLVGLATSLTGEKSRAFADLLSAGNEVMMKVISLVMYYAPLGLGAYFAHLTGVFGPQLLGAYLSAVALYYPLSLLYFAGGYTFYAWLAGGASGVKIFWSKIMPASLTALGTGSSLATIPANIQAADEIGVPHEISRLVIPIGATIHMDGTCISAVVKIAMLFQIYHMNFSGAATLATAVGVALLSGMVMTGIPGGGFLGELLIVSLYGFPPEALPIISMLGTLVDPPATMVNAIGSNVVSMMIARIMGGKNWMLRENFNALAGGTADLQPASLESVKLSD